MKLPRANSNSVTGKTKNLITIRSLALIFGLSASCDKKSEPGKSAADAAESVGTTLQKAANDVAASAQKVTTEVKTVAGKTVAEATRQVETAAASASGEAQEYIDKAKALVTGKKYQDALNSLQQLSGLTRSAEQQMMGDDLKKSIQAAPGNNAATDGTTAVGNQLNK